MKTINKIFCTLAILMALIFTGMQSANAQIHINVTWELCPDTCFTQDDCQYSIDYVLIDDCGETPVEKCSGFRTTNCSTTEVTFTCDFSCLDVTLDPCYILAARVQKKCIGHGGTIIVCEGSSLLHLSCNDLMNTDPILIPITW
jgi:hypothetical protein